MIDLTVWSFVVLFIFTILLFLLCSSDRKVREREEEKKKEEERVLRFGREYGDIVGQVYDREEVQNLYEKLIVKNEEFLERDIHDRQQAR